MNIYKQKYIWKLLLFSLALVIAILTLLYNYQLASQLEKEEVKKIQLLGLAYKEFQKNDLSADLILETAIITEDFNTTIPLIIIDEHDEIQGFRNINKKLEEKDISELTPKDSIYLKKRLAQMKASGNEPIQFPIVDDIVHTLYYSESSLLIQLRRYPYIQLGIISLFLLLAYWAFSAARRAEQNQVWVGMARETAHQLGTPLSSLVGWTELLNDDAINEDQLHSLSTEMAKDISRLSLIADRFSKIGSKPKLEQQNLVPAIQHSFHYMARRASKAIEFEFKNDVGESLLIDFSPPLLDWVIENLLKNGLDAMPPKGTISLHLHENQQHVFIDIADSGKGIPKSEFNTIFQPGFSKKKRGWGLGLSLSKRIVEQFHHGKIMVLDSAVNKGTTFRIALLK